MSPLKRKRNERGQYETGFNAAAEGSVVGKLVREEYEAFVERLQDKLNTLSAADLADIETPNWKDNIRSVLSQYLGASTAKVALNFVKDPTPWNLFTKENYARKASELRDEDTTETDAQFSQIMGALSSEYKEMSPNEREKYTRLSMPSAFGDVIQSPLKGNKRKNQLIKSMQRICESLNELGMVTLIYFSEKYMPDANPFVYYPKATSTSQDSVSVVRSFYQNCQDKGCGVNRFNLVVQADGAGLLSELGELPKKKIGKRKRIDALRSEFTKLVRQKYNESATPIPGPITSTTLPDHFFTKYLPEHSFKLEGAEDITDIKSLPLQRLELLIKDLKEGHVKFMEIGIPFCM